VEGRAEGNEVVDAEEDRRGDGRKQVAEQRPYPVAREHVERDDPREERPV